MTAMTRSKRTAIASTAALGTLLNRIDLYLTKDRR